MARGREFDTEVVLERALATFWLLGYEGASVRDLVQATGLKPQSLYNAFGDKRGLFVASLERYRGHVEAGLASLRGESAGLMELQKYMETFLAILRSQGVSACLLVKTAFGEQTTDQEIRALVTASGASVRLAFASVLARCVARGEVRAGSEPRLLAAYLFSVLHGLSALAHTGGSRAEVDATISQTFGALRTEGGTAPRTRKQNRGRP
jgi:TetR/AcrR family transcriptional repressor of nem operon